MRGPARGPARGAARGAAMRRSATALAGLLACLACRPGPGQAAPAPAPPVATVAPTEVPADGASRPRTREAGLRIGDLEPGPLDAITDVAGVLVGHRTLVRGDSVRTGVTAVLPHGGDLFRLKVPAAAWVGNGFGKAAGLTQVRELGEIETPIVLTNTLAVGTAVTAVVRRTLARPGHGDVRSVNAVVGETNDGWLDDIRSLPVTEADVLAAIEAARDGPVPEGAVGAGTGTVALGYKAGIGTASRLVPTPAGTWTVGVLVQANFGGELRVAGLPVGMLLGGDGEEGGSGPGDDGSCMVVVATDAPLSPRNLERLARRALLGLGRAGGIMSNGSGDYVIAFSTAYRIPHGAEAVVPVPPLLPNGAMTPLFAAVVEATEESVLNSLFRAGTVRGRAGHVAPGLPLTRVLAGCRRHGLLAPGPRPRPSRPETRR